MFCLRLLLLSALAPLALVAGEDDESQIWPSPGHRFRIEPKPAPSNAAVLPPEEWVEKAVATGDTASPEHLTRLSKVWFGEWRVRGDQFDGVLIVAHDVYHRLYLREDAKEAKPALRLKSPMAMAKEWSDELEKL